MKTGDGVELKVGMKVKASLAAVQKALEPFRAMAVAQGATKAQVDAGMAEMLAESAKLTGVVTKLQEPNKVTVQRTSQSDPGSMMKVTSSSTTVENAEDLVSVSGAALAPITSTSWLTKKVDLPVVGPVPRWGVGLGGAALLALVVALVRR